MDAVIEEQKAGDLEAIEALLDLAFGRDRHQKTAYRLRDNVGPVDELSLVARLDGELVGTIRFWPVVIVDGDGRQWDALLLGPIAVDPALKGVGIGKRLMQEGLARAQAMGHGLVILVGDLDYYGKMGFVRVPGGRLIFPGWVDEARVLYRELTPGAFERVAGQVQPAGAGAGGLQKNRL
ncbi:MAG: N-acetyltransferase [Alphaproteobacteria bacterium]|nr:MAG: N-acetyltransferase [Alphaproteobacteria bacterium]